MQSVKMRSAASKACSDSVTRYESYSKIRMNAESCTLVPYVQAVKFARRKFRSLAIQLSYTDAAANSQ